MSYFYTYMNRKCNGMQWVPCMRQAMMASWHPASVPTSCSSRPTSSEATASASTETGTSKRRIWTKKRDAASTSREPTRAARYASRHGEPFLQESAQTHTGCASIRTGSNSILRAHCRGVCATPVIKLSLLGRCTFTRKGRGSGSIILYFRRLQTGGLARRRQQGSGRIELFLHKTLAENVIAFQI